MHLMTACLLACLLMIFRVSSTEPELPTLGDWASAEWIDNWYNNDATAAMQENPSLPADHSSSTIQATQKDQQASWGDDPYCIRHIPGAVIPPSTHSPSPHPPHSQASPDPEVLKAHSQTNHGLATNNHALVVEETIPGDLRAITHPLPEGSDSQDPLDYLFSLWAGAQQPSVGSQFMPESSQTSPARLPSNVLHFTDNPHLPSSKTAPQPGHQDAITLDNLYNLLTESSAAQEEPHTFRPINYNYPTGQSASELMSLHPPLPHLAALAGPEIQTTQSQNAGLDTRWSNPTGLFGHKPNPWDLQTMNNHLTNSLNSPDSFNHLISLSPSSAPQLMPHSSNLASGFSHILHVPENSQQPSFKTKIPQYKQITHQRIPELKPLTKTLKKKALYTKKIWTKNSSCLSQTTHPEKSLPLPAEMNELTPPDGPLKFHITLFEDVSPQDPLIEQAWRKIFQLQIDKLPGKLLIIQQEKFEETYVKYLGRNSFILPDLTRSSIFELMQRILIGKVIEFQGDMELWYRRWHMITLFDFKKNSPLPHTKSANMANIVEVIFPLYLFYIEMICSIVPRESTASKDLGAELKSAQRLFTILSNDPSTLLQSRLVKHNRQSWHRCPLPILWVYLGHWMRNERPGVFAMIPQSEDVKAHIKCFFNRAFALSYSAVARRYTCKKQI